MNTKQIVGVTILAIGLLIGGLGLAQAGPGKFCETSAEHAGPEQRRHADGPLHHLTEELGLDQAQRDSIDAIMDKHRDSLKEQRQAMRDIRGKLHQAISAEEYDSEQVKTLAGQQARLAAEFTVHRNQMLRDIYQQMTPEQQARFKLLRKKHRHHEG